MDLVGARRASDFGQIRIPECATKGERIRTTGTAGDKNVIHRYIRQRFQGRLDRARSRIIRNHAGGLAVVGDVKGIARDRTTECGRLDFVRPANPGDCCCIRQIVGRSKGHHHGCARSGATGKDDIAGRDIGQVIQSRQNCSIVVIDSQSGRGLPIECQRVGIRGSIARIRDCLDFVNANIRGHHQVLRCSCKRTREFNGPWSTSTAGDSTVARPH